MTGDELYQINSLGWDIDQLRELKDVVRQLKQDTVDMAQYRVKHQELFHMNFADGYRIEDNLRFYDPKIVCAFCDALEKFCADNLAIREKKFDDIEIRCKNQMQVGDYYGFTECS